MKKHEPYQIVRLRKDNRMLREALQRLASMEAFAAPRAVHASNDEELLLRIDFARAAVAKLRVSVPGSEGR